ncbi:beta-mannosidase [Breznakiella homolactica]|uniref:Beta-mannosidase B n=1 Tax=Breznakiella homolactica TaxID=2798577 RepID=A0A7T7XLA4_9SPIR|nr:glycoside hydrolase family 2 protein [Breznakiella homolactica]QQO08489.1 glycoside hydrolase family 2 protein [Breznakiella homolactica]
MQKKQLLSGVWEWKAADDPAFRRGTVPGSVLCDMLDLGLIEDPFWRLNEYPTRELMGRDYIYRRSFSVSEEDLSADRIELVCEGIDTIAAVSINGRPAASVDDMHRTHRIPAADFLKPGENEIIVEFSSALRFVREEDAANDIHYASTGSIHGNAAIRKAHYMFGWDWGPQLPDMGIFRDIYIEYTRDASLDDVRIRQFHFPGENRVDLTIEAEVSLFGTETAELRAEIESPRGKHFSVNGIYRPGENLVLSIPEPELWWPNNLGDQPLYSVTVRLLAGGAEQDRYDCRIGLRTITVSTDADEYGNEFAFMVNGVKIFAMGANYIPQDSLIPRITPQRYRTMVKECAEANFNCLRVWGGGYYPGDAFYDACDEYGILVWQDLMFACNVYALNDHFEQNITAETRDVVRRLRHRACLGLWCGNNEMEWGWGEGWKRILGHHPRYKADYLKIFEMVLPRELIKHDDQTFFWPSSPSSGGAYDFPNDPDRGDQHYWEVWHSGKPFTEYRASHFRFCSEYGFQSFPHSKTLASFTLPEDRNIFSEVMESHQKNGTANSKIFTYISDYFRYPKDLDSIAYISQILQLKAIQYGVEHWRRNRGRCMGSLYWQLDDCWPVASWASIDYFGRWKALHYGAKRFYAPLIASACEREELDTEITYFIHNDSLKSEQCRLEVTLMDTEFKVLHSAGITAEAPPLSAAAVLTVDFAPFIPDGNTRKRVFARYRLLRKDSCVSQGTTMFVKPKHFELPQVSYETAVTDLGDTYEISVRAGGFSNYTEVFFRNTDAVLSDNFFDITGPEAVRITAEKSRLSRDPGAGGLAQELAVRSAADSYAREELWN